MVCDQCKATWFVKKKGKLVFDKDEFNKLYGKKLRRVIETLCKFYGKEYGYFPIRLRKLSNVKFSMRKCNSYNGSLGSAELRYNDIVGIKINLSKFMWWENANWNDVLLTFIHEMMHCFAYQYFNNWSHDSEFKNFLFKAIRIFWDLGFSLESHIWRLSKEGTIKDYGELRISPSRPIN